MIITLKKNTPNQEVDHLIQQFESQNLKVSLITGENYNVFGLVGDTAQLDERRILANEWVENVQRIAAPYKMANRMFHHEDSIIDVGGIKVGGQEPIVIIGGPCSVEGREMMEEIAVDVKNAGGSMLRGGAYKPRTSPYADLLKAVGKMTKPILLKRGLSATIEEWIMSAEYIMASGNPNVIFCERGIRTFEKYTRNTLDLSVIPILKEKTHLPVIIDPSHATGDWKLVESMSLAAIAAGADGLIIEVHNNPECAWSDGMQSLKPEKFKNVIEKAKLVAQSVGRSVYEG